MVLVGLTGGMGAGKSTVAAWFGLWGAAVVDADAAGRAALALPVVHAALRAAFGPTVISPDGQVDRGALAGQAFADAAACQRLNAIMREPLSALLWATARQAAGRVGPGGLVVVDAPLLCEWDLDACFDVIVVVAAPVAVRMDRVMSRSGLTAEQVRLRLSCQVDEDAHRRRADLVIDNDSTATALAARAAGVWEALTAPEAPWARRDLDLDSIGLPGPGRRRAVGAELRCRHEGGVDPMPRSEG